MTYFSLQEELLMLLKELSEITCGRYAPWLVEEAQNAYHEAVAEDPTVLRREFHAAAVMSASGSGNIYRATTRWHGPNPGDKNPAILQALSEMATHGDDDVLLIAVYGGKPGEAPRIHEPCDDCKSKIVAYDADGSCEIVVEERGRLMLKTLETARR